MKSLRRSLLLPLLVATLGVLLVAARAWTAAQSDPVALRGACRQAGVKYPPPALRVEVRKGERILDLFSGKARLKRYRVGLGFHPIGDKEKQGDGRTPEGEFYVCTRLKQSKFHRFLGLSYPAPEDAARGRKTGMITASEAKQITGAHGKRRLPPWNTALGGAVGIHGSGSATDWTAGCVAVEDTEIEELFAVLNLGTPVRILP